MFLLRVEAEGVYRCDSVNRSYTKVTGLREDQVVGFRPEEILPAEAAEYAMMRYRQAIDAGVPITYSEDILLPAGRVVFETTLTPVIDDTGTCTYLLGALRDITARRIAEERLQASEARYRQIFESNGSIQFLVDIETSQIVDVNAAATRFYGWARDEMRAMKVSDIALFGDRTWDEYAREIRGAAGLPRVREHRLASGEIRTVEIFSGEFATDGRPHFHAIVHDISDRVRAEDALRDSEARFRSALDNSPDLFAVLDTVRDAEGAIVDFRVVEVNARAGAILGVDGARMIGRSFRELLPYATNSALLRSLVLVAETGNAEETELQPRVGPLADTWLSCQIVPLGRGVALTARDVTARRRAEDQLRALSLIDDLTGLYNRRGFEEQGAQQLEKARLSSKCSYLFYFDMNDFKAINDTWGHSTGDEALVRMASVLRQTFRDSDVIARLGGDEFVALVINSGEMVPEILDRLQIELEMQNSRRGASGSNYLLSTAIGVARFDPGSSVTLGDLQQVADKELYHDKKHGGRRHE